MGRSETRGHPTIRSGTRFHIDGPDDCEFSGVHAVSGSETMREVGLDVFNVPARLCGVVAGACREGDGERAGRAAWRVLVVSRGNNTDCYGRDCRLQTAEWKFGRVGNAVMDGKDGM